MKVVDIYDLSAGVCEKALDFAEDDAAPPESDRACERSCPDYTNNTFRIIVRDTNDAQSSAPEEDDSIAEVSVSDKSEGYERATMFMVKLSEQMSNTGTVFVQQLPLDLDEKQFREIQWYLEEYVTENPFENSRAQAALSLLRNHAKSIVERINWKSSINTSPSEHRLVFRIHSEHNSRSKHVFWELLENHELWPAKAPTDIQVLRVPFSRFNDPLSIFALKHRETYNILVVSARPKVDADIPYRIISRIILEVVDNLPAEMKELATVEFVRPGTFESLQEHLGRRKGYFNLVHFDLHGSEDESNNAYLDFLSATDTSESITISRNSVDATDLAVFLKAQGVKYVVINACRSARGSDIHSNIALTMLKHGIWGCVAMAYNIVARSVEIFTRAFYEALLTQDASFDVAATIGRRALSLLPNRRSKFGQLVAINDSMVPIVYLHGRTNWTPRHPTKPIQITDYEAAFDSHPYGRENDILKIETALLSTNRPLLLSGVAGVGKTCLSKCLVSWWKRSDLVTKCTYIQLSQTASQLKLQETVYANREDDLISEILRGDDGSTENSSKMLLVIDGFELVSEATGAHGRRQRNDIKRFLSKLTKLKCLIIITSRRQEQWLSSVIQRYQLKGLGTLAGIELFEYHIKTCQSIAISPSYDGLKDGQFLEQIVKLVDGNPLALIAIANDFLCRHEAPQQYFLSLLTGAPFLVNRVQMQETEGWRSLMEIDRLIDESNPQTWTDGFRSTILAQFWQFFPEHDLLVFGLLFSSQSLNRFGLDIESQLSGFQAFIASMQELFPSFDPDFDKFLQQVNNMKSLVENQEMPIDSIALLIFDEDMSIEDITTQLPMLQYFSRILDRVIKPLKAAHFLESYELQNLAPKLQSKDYLSIHPLLPLMLRSKPDYHQNFLNFREIVKEGFSLYYTYRARSFPFMYMSYNPIWDIPRQQLSLEFINFAAATLIALQQKISGSIRNASMFKLLISLHKALLEDVGRFRILVPIWELAVEHFKEVEARISSERHPASALKRLASRFSRLASKVPDNQNRTSEDQLHLPEGLSLFKAREHLLSVLPPLVLHYRKLRSEKQDYYIRIAEDCYRRLKSDGFPDTFPQKEKIYLGRAFDKLIYDVRLSVSFEAPSSTELWERRQEFHKMVVAHNGVETTPEEQKGWQDIPVHMLASAALQLKLNPAVFQIDQAIDQRRFKEARKLIDDALLEEINEAGNDEVNKATLLRYRSKVDEEQGRWHDALKHHLEAEEYEHRATLEQGKPSNVDLAISFLHEARTRRLARKVEEEMNKVTRPRTSKTEA